MIQLIFVRMGTVEFFDKTIDNFVSLGLSKDGRKYVTAYTLRLKKILENQCKNFHKKNL